MVIDPNMSEEDAKDKLMRIKEEKAKSIGAMFGNTRQNIEEDRPGLESGAEESEG